MELDAELFEQITTALGAQRDEAEAGRDGVWHRTAGRYTVAADVLLEPHGVRSPRPRRVKLRSLSRTGAAILDTVPAQPGERVLIHLPKPDGHAIPIVCVIRNIRMSGPEFRIGMQFMSQAEQTGPQVVRGTDGLINRPPETGPLDVLERIARERPMHPGTGPTGDRDERVVINAQGMMCSYSDGRTGPVYFVKVKDISPAGGVCIVQPEPMEPGEQFVLQIPRRQGTALTLICTAIGCRRLDDDSFRIGARFVTTLLRDVTNPSGRNGIIQRVRRWFAA
jgi:hypothetical protein